MVFEDAHSSDPSSLEMLDLTIDRIQSLPVFLMVVTFQPILNAAWTGQSGARNDAGPQSAESPARGRDAGATDRRQSGSAGSNREGNHRADRWHPLFVEELTKSIMEAWLRSAEDPNSALVFTHSPALAVPAGCAHP